MHAPAGRDGRQTAAAAETAAGSTGCRVPRYQTIRPSMLHKCDRNSPTVRSEHAGAAGHALAALHAPPAGPAQRRSWRQWSRSDCGSRADAPVDVPCWVRAQHGAAFADGGGSGTMPGSFLPRLQAIIVLGRGLERVHQLCTVLRAPLSTVERGAKGSWQCPLPRCRCSFARPGFDQGVNIRALSIPHN